MGVTIHFEGRLKSNKDFDKVVFIAKEFAEKNEIEFSFFEESDKLLLRVKDGKEFDYQGITRGIRIQPHDNSDPLNLEFDKDNYMQEYCKTQFAEIDTHIKIVDFLRQIEPYFEKLNVEDKGEYWETKSVEILQKHIDNCFAAIEDLKKERKDLSGPYRIEDGRIIDLM